MSGSNYNINRKKNVDINNNTSFIQFKKHLILSNKTEYKKVITRLKYKCSLFTIKNVIDDLTKNNNGSYDEYIFGNPLPKTYSDLGKGKNLFQSDESFEREVNWCILAIEKFSLQINEFLLLKDSFEINLYKGDYVKANIILEKIESDICVSTWSLENKFVLSEYRYGLEENKEQLNQINEGELNIIVSWIAEFLSRKAEKTTSIQKYINSFNKFLENFNQKFKAKSLAEFLTFKLNFYFGEKMENFIDIIHIENIFSIVDRYLTLIKVFQIICSDKSTSEDKVIQKYVYRLRKKINDTNLDKLLIYLDPNADIKTDYLSDLLINISDLYTLGKYQECFILTKKEILKNTNCFELYEYYIKSLLYIKLHFEKPIEGDSILNNVLESLFISYTNGEKVNESMWNKLKIVQNIGNSNFGNQLFLSVNDKIMDKKISGNTLKELNSKFLNPRLSRAYTSINNSYIYLCNLEGEYNQSITIKFWKQYYSMLIEYDENQESKLKDFNIDEIRLKRYLAQIYEYNHLYAKAIDLNSNIIDESKELNENYRIYIYQKVIVRLYNCFIKVQKIHECKKLIINNFLDNGYLNKRINLHNLISLIENLDNQEIYADISMPIIYFLDDPKDHNRIYGSYDNFLYKNEVNKASELILFQEKYEKSELIFFLRYICISDNVDGSYYFSGTDDLEKERISLCQWLTNLDPDNKKVYNEEISNITQKSMIRKRIQQIDDSKIYVDVEGIRNSSYNMIKESYDRYIKLTGILHPYKILDLNDMNNVSYTTETVYLLEANYSQKPRYVLFNEIFIEIRDKFISRYEYGLDYYLGMRIRHGTLLSQLRKQFDANNLITNKNNKESEEYAINAYWEKKITHLNNNLTNNIQQILAGFSKSVDDVISKVPNQWIQIKTESKNLEGLFDFTIYQADMVDYFYLCKDINNFDEFIETVFNVLWKLTETNLEKVRNKISNDLKQEFINNLDNLENHIVNLSLIDSSDSSIKELLRNVAICRTNIQNELENISRWFNLAKNKNNINFNMFQLIEVCLEIIKNIHPKYANFSWDIDVQKGSTFQGKVFTYFVDIVLILLNNVVINSGLKPSMLECEIKTFEDEDFFSIVIKNNVSQERKKVLVNDIKSIKRKIDNINDIRTYASIEGGSGYPKIFKTLKYDLKTENSINVDAIDDDIFKVEIRLDKRRLIVDEDSNS